MFVADIRDCVSELRDPAFLTNILAKHRQVHGLSRIEGMCRASCLLQIFFTIKFLDSVQEIVLIRNSGLFTHHPCCRFSHNHFHKSTSR